MKYRKKPVVIDAIQYLGPFSYDEMIMEWGSMFENASIFDSTGIFPLKLFTLEGKMIVRVSDWIIKGIKGEFYPIKNDIFRKTYESVV